MLKIDQHWWTTVPSEIPQKAWVPLQHLLGLLCSWRTKILWLIIVEVSKLTVWNLVSPVLKKMVQPLTGRTARSWAIPAIICLIKNNIIFFCSNWPHENLNGTSVRTGKQLYWGIIAWCPVELCPVCVLSSSAPLYQNNPATWAFFNISEYSSW